MAASESRHHGLVPARAIAGSVGSMGGRHDQYGVAKEQGAGRG